MLMKGGNMKYLLFVLLLVALLMTAGCVGGDRNSVVTSTMNIPDNISQNVNNEENLGLQFRSEKYNIVFLHPEGTVVNETILEPSSSEKIFYGRTENRYELNILNLSTRRPILEITIDPNSRESVDDYISRIKISNNNRIESDLIKFNDTVTVSSIDNEKAAKMVSVTRSTIANKVDQKAYVLMEGEMYRDTEMISTSYFVVHKNMSYWFFSGVRIPGDLNEIDLDNFVTNVHFIK